MRSYFAFFAFLVLGGCNLYKSGSDTPAPVAEQTPPDAFAPLLAEATVDARLASDEGPCAGSLLSMGDSQTLLPAQDGVDGATVTCSVEARNGLFGVTATAIDADGTGSIEVEGVLSGAPLGVLHARIRGGGKSIERDCTIAYPEGGGVAAGKILATLSCPGDAAATTAPEMCLVTARIHFGNCR